MGKKPDETPPDETPDETPSDETPDETPPKGRVPLANLKPIKTDVDALKLEVIELRKALVTVLKSVQHLEKETGTSIMPEGTFLGVTF